MKTLKLTRAESAAYAAGERCFWREMRKQPQPRHGVYARGAIIDFEYLVWDHAGEVIPFTDSCMYRVLARCPYGTTGDYIKLISRGYESKERKITAITVTQRDGKWGWLVEVGA
jgi:hypothetical protein